MARSPYKSKVVTPQQAVALFEQLIADMMVIEQGIAEWRQSIFFLASSGGSTCETLRQYNAAAINNYYQLAQLMTLLHDVARGTSAQAILDAQLPRAPKEPVVFGHATSFKTFAAYGHQALLDSVRLDCQDSFPAPGLQVFGDMIPGPCPTGDQPMHDPTKGKPLGIAASNLDLFARCAANLAACGIGALVIGAVIWKSAGFLDKLTNLFINVASVLPWVAHLQEQKAKVENNKTRAKVQAMCWAKVTDGLDMSKVSIVERQKLAKTCTDQANAAVPDIGGSFWTVMIPLGIIAGVTVVAVTGVKLYFKHRENKSAQRLQPRYA